MKCLYASVLLLVIFLSSCSSSKLVEAYKNPEIATFEASKVLVIGLTADKLLRRGFEKSVAEALDKHNIIAVKSIDFFETHFTIKKQTQDALNALESQLLEAGFDAILLTKVTGEQARVSLLTVHEALGAEKHKRFNNYYYDNQNLFFNNTQEPYIVYTTETMLYCICPEKDRELLWQGHIEVIKAKDKKNIKHYTKTLIKTLRDNNLLLVQ